VDGEKLQDPESDDGGSSNFTSKFILPSIASIVDRPLPFHHKSAGPLHFPADSPKLEVRKLRVISELRCTVYLQQY
jgi:hypothetical protein